MPAVQMSELIEGLTDIAVRMECYASEGNACPIKLNLRQFLLNIIWKGDNCK